jgi:peptidoglycan/xylan/chitin deacetylase (PgdA/CDA1 family)
MRELSFANGVDLGALCREECMHWDELAFLAGDPLVTIGAHTVTHPILARLSGDQVRSELLDGARILAAKLGRMPAHFAYPVGGADAAGPREFAAAAGAGFKTAVTTRPGVLFLDHARHLTALPRISVNGAFQRMRYLDVLLSGAPTALLNGFKRVDAA